MALTALPARISIGHYPPRSVDIRDRSKVRHQPSTIFSHVNGTNPPTVIFHAPVHAFERRYIEHHHFGIEALTEKFPNERFCVRLIPVLEINEEWMARKYPDMNLQEMESRNCLPQTSVELQNAGLSLQPV